MCILCELGITKRAKQNDAIPIIPAEILSGREVVQIHVNGQQTAIQRCEIGQQVFNSMAGNPGDSLTIEVNNYGMTPVLAVIALNGLSVLTGKPASRDDDAVLILPGTSCQIMNWFDGSPLKFFGVPVDYDPTTIQTGTLGVYTYQVDEKPDPGDLDLGALMGGLGAAIRQLMGAPTPSQKRSGAWKELRTGSPVPARLFPRQYPAGHAVEIRYDTVDNLAKRNIHILDEATLDYQPVDSWWTNPVFPGDNRPYTGGKPQESRSAQNEQSSIRRRRPSWERETSQV